MRATSHQNYLSNAFGHSEMLKESVISSRFDRSAKMENSIPGSNTDLFGFDNLRCALVNPSRQSTPSILNLAADKHQTSDSYVFDPPNIMNISRKDAHGLGLEVCPRAEDNRPPKLNLNLLQKHPLSPNRNNGSSPPFSDSSLSTGSSNFDMSFFPQCIPNGRSDSPNSEGSNSSNDSTANRKNFSFPQMTDQELTNLHNLHVIHCISNMSKDQFLHMMNAIQSFLQTPPNSPPSIVENDTLKLESMHHRTAAVSGNAEAQFTWSGKLPRRSQKGGPYSSKVFLGGVPWDITEEMLICSFQQFGNVKVEWPGKEAISQPKGYAYIIFENEIQVKILLDSCRECGDENEGSFYYKIPSRRSKPKEVQVIPWAINDSNYSVKTFQKLNPLKTVFVGALHGMMNAEGLFRVMDDLFGGVLYAGIDTDKNKYPIGSGRVTFDNYKSYVKAVSAAFVDIKTAKFIKKVQIDPYLEDTPCSLCHVKLGPYFCREDGCFRYFCTTCWKLHHMYLRIPHKPLMRNSKHGCSLTSAITVSPH